MSPKHEAVEKASHSASFCAMDLRDALSHATPTEAIILLDLIAAAATLQTKINALAVAIEPAHQSIP